MLAKLHAVHATSNSMQQDLLRASIYPATFHGCEPTLPSSDELSRIRSIAMTLDPENIDLGKNIPHRQKIPSWSWSRNTVLVFSHCFDLEGIATAQQGTCKRVWVPATCLDYWFRWYVVFGNLPQISDTHHQPQTPDSICHASLDAIGVGCAQAEIFASRLPWHDVKRPVTVAVLVLNANIFFVNSPAVSNSQNNNIGVLM